ncbi:MAG: Maf family protein [Candidatus Thermoplasmatota archaeon]|nr:Maf family protein [Candidatus Thermoplasmatota archaeon]
MPVVLLASASARRRAWLSERLRGTGAALKVTSLLAPEPPPASGSEVKVQVEQTCLSKAHAAVMELTVGGSHELPNFTLVADTLVEDPDDPLVPLGKPSNKVSAAAMRLRLSGRRHRVWSSTAILHPPGETRGTEALHGGWTADVWTESSIVEFDELDDERAMGMIESESWRGKAGGYDMAGEARSNLRLVEGDEVTVLGFAPNAIESLTGMIP